MSKGRFWSNRYNTEINTFQGLVSDYGENTGHIVDFVNTGIRIARSDGITMVFDRNTDVCSHKVLSEEEHLELVHACNIDEREKINNQQIQKHYEKIDTLRDFRVTTLESSDFFHKIVNPLYYEDRISIINPKSPDQEVQVNIGKEVALFPSTSDISVKMDVVINENHSFDAVRNALLDLCFKKEKTSNIEAITEFSEQKQEKPIENQEEKHGNSFLASNLTVYNKEFLDGTGIGIFAQKNAHTITINLGLHDGKIESISGIKNTDENIERCVDIMNDSSSIEDFKTKLQNEIDKSTQQRAPDLDD